MSQRALDPGNYDLAELRDVVEEDGSPEDQTADDEPRNGQEAVPPADDGLSIDVDAPDESGSPTLRRSVRQELELLDEVVEEPRPRPYLETLPETPAIEAEVVEWLDHLATTAGRDRAAEALTFYRSIGWISPEVETRLSSYLDLVDAPDHHDTVPLGPRDHQVSLFYVSRLALVEG